MGVYDKYNFDGLKFFSLIKTHPSLSVPCGEFLRIIRQLKNAPSRNISVAEIGIGYGAAALPALKMLDRNDVYYCFDLRINSRTWRRICIRKISA